MSRRPVSEPTCYLPQVLALSNNGIGAEGAKAISAACPTLPKLKELHLSGNHLGDAGVAALFGPPLGSKPESPSSSSPRFPCLSRLLLDNNYSISGEGARALGACLNPIVGSCPSLLELRLAKNSVGPEGARQLAAGLCVEGCLLRVLDLTACKVRAEGAVHLGQALVLNSSPVWAGKMLFEMPKHSPRPQALIYTSS